MSYHFTRYQPKYREEIVHLQRDLWSSDLAINSAYLAWKYEQNPYIEQPLIYLALQNERVVGIRGYYGARWQIGRTEQSVILPCAGDTIIAHEHRTGGLLRQLLRFEQTDGGLANFPCVLSFSASAPVYLYLLRKGWRIIGAHDTLVRNAPFRKLLKSGRLRGWTRRPAIDTLWKVAAHLWRPSWSSRHIRSSLEPRPEEMAKLAARASQPDKIRLHKDSAYYAWRFRSPLRRYQFFYWQKATLEGFLVLQRSSSFEADTVHLIDWAAATNEVLLDLLYAAVQGAGLRSMEIWSASLPETMIATLVLLGFSPAERPTPVKMYRPAALIRCPDSSLLAGQWSLGGWDISDLENWDLRMVYSDRY